MINTVKYHFTVIFICLSFLANSQTFSISLDKDSMLIGDHFVLSLEAHFQSGQQVFLPQLVDSMISFDILEVYAPDTAGNSLNQDYLLTQFDAGIYKIEQLPALLLQENGRVDTLYSNSIDLFVNTIEVDTTQAFKAIKPVKSLPFPWKSFLKKLALILLPILVLIALIIWYILRKNNFQIFKEKPKTMLDYYQEAIDKLEKLEKQKLWQNDQIKEYYLGMSEILREYVEGRFGIQAMESTTDEIKEALYLDKGLKIKIIEILQQADLAKFAKFRPLGDENIKMMKMAKDFVSHTKPKTIEEINAK